VERADEQFRDAAALAAVASRGPIPLPYKTALPDEAMRRREVLATKQALEGRAAGRGGRLSPNYPVG
jgi:hypothetical protein